MAVYINNPEEPVQLYEVIRITEGMPLFLEDHLGRLYQSARLTGVNQLPDPDSRTALIKNFITTQKMVTGNILLLCFLCITLSSDIFNFSCYFLGIFSGFCRLSQIAIISIVVADIS
jgi:branched-chain amino acid aminotransferase